MDENIPRKLSFRVRCSKCGHVFTAHKSPPTEKPYFLQDEVKSIPDNSGRGKVIAISNQKGGVAKTSTCLNLGISLSLLKKRVLVIDFDAQSNLTIALGHKKTKGFYEALLSDTESLLAAIEKTRYPDLWLLPANSQMAVLTRKYSNGHNLGELLKDKLNLVKDRFDYILIDTPPSIEFFTLNALMASNFVIIPSQCEYLSTHGITQIEKIINTIKLKTDQDIDYKVLITMYDSQNTASKVIRTKLKNSYKEKTFNTTIDFDTKMQESQIVGRPVIYYDKNSSSGRQYISLAKEFMRDSHKS